MGGSAASAVVFDRALKSAVRGPGYISGASIAVNLWSSHEIEVSQVIFEGVQNGVIAQESSRVEVVQNTFRKVQDKAIFIGSALGQGGASHSPLIHFNTIHDVGSGIHLCGTGTYDARVRFNEIRRSRGWGIFLYDGASQAMVVQNTVGVTGWQAAIELRSASTNVVMDNTLLGNGQQTGVMIGSLVGQTCRVTPGATADRNVVTRNTVEGFLAGLRVGYGNGQLAYENNTLGNQYLRNAVDLALDRDSYWTDARGNDQGGRGAGRATVSDAGSLSLY
jgi:hypothetical protein